ncbi:glycosyltransferase [Pseudomonas mosselii]|uniref:glycosyltransferase n=1 Tax=Pseudomonas mosselii TaxID=78327 RepID=UPI001EE2533A|nr:glycosyltransferase [Pseudomonas mosselii]MEB5934056.1 glycosyltransferase [Pseudomonas mosselii]
MDCVDSIPLPAAKLDVCAMSNVFPLPEGLLGRFGVVKLWPGIKTAEDECIARLKLAARAIGIECIEVHADGGYIDAPDIKASKSNVDFVIHLHYDTPKRYDAFSFVALWNPLKFYHEWGYQRCSRNLTTHDDFLSCSSDAADDHVARMVRTSTTHLPAHFNLYHSTPEIVHGPSLGDGKLFYAGINWEAIVSSRKSRQQEVLKRLDPTGLLKIYGPTVFQGVKVWEDYQSYVREIPFDGFSMINEIAKAGAALVLSSQAHRDSEMMSNRLFETVAAGTLVICDENPFARRFFGDSLLYIDSRSPMEQIYSDITAHLSWIKENPDEALAKIEKAQALFREHYSLIGSLKTLYSGLNARKQQLVAHHLGDAGEQTHVSLNLLMLDYSTQALKAHVESVRRQDYVNFTPTLVIDKRVADSFKPEISAILDTSPVPIRVKEVEGHNYGIHPDIKAKRRLGQIFQEVIDDSADADAIIFVAPNEKLLSNHLTTLVGALQSDSELACAATAAIMDDGHSPVHTVHELLDFGHVDAAAPPGYGRFIFRTSALPRDLVIALPYLDGRPLAAMISGKIKHLLPATVTLDTRRSFPERTWDEAAETELIKDYNPGVLKVSAGFYLPDNPAPVVIQQMSQPALYKKFLNKAWVKAQIQAIRTHGLKARLEVLQRKLSS